MSLSIKTGLQRRDLLALVGAAGLSILSESLLAAPDTLKNPPAQRLGKLRLKRIDNMDIYTTNLPRLVNFYTNTLGLNFFLPYEPDKDWAAVDFGNLTCYMFKANLGEHAPPRPIGRIPGLDSFAFEVDDLDASILALDGSVDWLQQKPATWSHPNGTHYRYRAFYDPDGNKLYLTEPHKAI
jgi:catechol 2,3-dioxygenase-like lactoylglutathione lyase family enzyme